VTDRPLILIADDAPTNLMTLMECLKKDYAVIAARTGEQALKLAAGAPVPDLILLDIMMPGMDGYRTLELLKANPNTSAIPVIFITALTDETDQSRGLTLGAVDYITKPFNSDIVKLRIANQLELKRDRDDLERLVRERTRELVDTRLEVVNRLGRAAEYRDNETGLHIIRMSNYAKLIAHASGLSDSEIELVLHASPMHDIGKIGVPDTILLKPGPLDPAEWERMKDHCRIGADILGGQDSALMRMAADAALSHHERWDGSGYPNRLKADEIPFIGRVVAVADVFDALTSRRPYKSAWELDAAFSYIESEAGRHFDPAMARAFIGLRDQILEIHHRYAE